MTYTESPVMTANRFEKRFVLLSKIFAYLTVIVGLLVLIGWTFNDRILKSIDISSITMKVNTAITFMLAGLSLMLLMDGGKNTPQHRAGIILILIFLLISMLTLTQDIFRLDFRIDQLLFKDNANLAGTVAPGRMSPSTAVCFILFAVSLLLLDAGKSRVFLLGRLCAFAAGFISFFLMTCHLFGVSVLLGRQQFTGMSFYASVALFIFFLGVVFARPGRGVIKELAADNPGGIVLRYSMPSLTALMLFLGWLKVNGENRGIFDSHYGDSIFTVIRTVIVIFIAYLVSKFVNKYYRERIEKDDALFEIQVKYTDIAEVDRLKSQFIAVISHELRTPLTIIKGFSAFLNNGSAGLLNERQKEYVGIIKHNTERLGNIISEMTDISRIETGIFTMEKGMHSMKLLVDRCVNDIGHIAQSAGVTVSGLTLPENLVMNIDAPRMEQVVMNLLNNAVKFSNKGGRVTAAVNYPYMGQGPMNEPGFLPDKEKYALLSVTDTGSGVDQADVGKIFSRFFQAEEHTTRHYQGMGLGLYIAKNIITGHGGFIWAESRGRDMGTTINALIPDTDCKP